MNRPIEDSNHSDLKQEVEAPHKKIKEMESAQARWTITVLPRRGRRLFRNPAFSLLTVIVAVPLTFGVLSAQQASKPDVLSIDQNGNVGINQPKPEKTLDVNGNTMIRGVTQINPSTGAAVLQMSSKETGYGTLKLQYLLDKDKANPLDEGNHSIGFGDGVGNWLLWSEYSKNGTHNAYIKGNLGIGTGTPNFPLSFPSTLGDKIGFWGGEGNHYGLGIQGKLLQIHTPEKESDIAFGYGSSGSFTETMRITGNGSVGIGTKDPDPKAKLQVNGDIKLGGDGSMYASAAPENLRIVRGNVNADGTIKNGAGFTVEHRKDSGVFTIRFQNKFSDVPSATASQIALEATSSTLDNVLIGSLTTDAATFYLGNSGGTKTDRSFSFIVMGPR